MKDDLGEAVVKNNKKLGEIHKKPTMKELLKLILQKTNKDWEWLKNG